MLSLGFDVRPVLVSLLGLVLACNPSPSTPASAAPTDASPQGSDASLQGSDESATPEEPPSPEPSITKVAPFVSAVHGMAVDEQGTLYFSDSFSTLDPTPRVYRLEPPYTGQPQATSIEGPRPAGLAFIDGDLHVCDVGAGTVRRYDHALAPTQTWEVPTPWNVARSTSGVLMVATFDGRLVELRPDGLVAEVMAGLDMPFDLEPGSGGSWWISEQVADPELPGRLLQWNPSDERGAQPVPYEWANPEGLATDPRGDLWVAETERRELVRISAERGVERMAQTDGLPVVIAPLPSGNLLVSVTGPQPHLLRIEFSR